MNERIIDRLRKLLNHERSAREIGNIEEAEAFAVKIQQMLDNYNLAMSDIDIEEARSTVAGEETEYKVQHVWQRQLLGQIAEINGCQMIVTPPYICIVGTEGDRAIVNEVYRYFEGLGLDLAMASLKEYKALGEYRRKRKKTRATLSYKGSFLLGYALSLSRRLQDQHKASMQTASEGTALIYIGNKMVDAEHWTNTNMVIRTRPAKKVKAQVFRNPAFSAGIAAGESVALTSKTIC